MPKWTKAQERAIYEPSGEGNIIVSAAAGSGKTAVLVERIVNMIMRNENPISIDRLLIVTFTEASAQEMKERIINRINSEFRKALKEGDEKRSKRLKEQIYMAVNADINTIDAFCLRVVKNNFHVLGIDPNFNIMDKSEGEMLAEDTLDELFLQFYETSDLDVKERFERLTDIYASNRDDEGLKKEVLKIYNFIQSFPQPDKWLEEKAQMYDEDMTKSKWVQEIFLKQHKNEILAEHGDKWEKLASKMAECAEKYFEGDKKVKGDIYTKYWGSIWEKIKVGEEAVREIKNMETLDDGAKIYKKYAADKSTLGTNRDTPPKKKIASDEDWRYYYLNLKYLRSNLRESIEVFPNIDTENFNKLIHAKEIKQNVDDIVWLVKEFMTRYEENKTLKNEKSFSDVEHLAYRLFHENENIREEYAQRYEEILIDEYQDTNGLQDAIFTSISRDNSNMFMVGDLKQSIYRFRGGDPTIFKTKGNEYAKSDSKGKRILLSDNFRSRKEVILGVNDIFSRVMTDEVGDVDYNDDEALKRDDDKECYIDGDNLLNPANKEIGYKPELYRIAVIKDEKEEDVTLARAEATYIAKRIREMVDSGYMVYDGDGKYRRVEYRDFLILMRSIRTRSSVVGEILSNHGIPAFVQKAEYFDRREIRLMLSLITLINNHRQDIPLVAVMRSPIGGFDENELAKIRIFAKHTSFYDAVLNYSKYEKGTGMEKKISDKCRYFLNDLERWRGYVKTKSIASLIWTLYEETGIYDLMGSIEGGNESQANLKLLYERAKKFESSGFKGIFNFIRYIERVESRNEDIGGAKLINENHNVVRIMTIHKSKGLESPIVFLVGTEVKFRKSNASVTNKILLHKDLGLGMDYYNYENLYSKKLMFNRYINDVNERESISEEMRLLYVAMTRAKEKLIVTAVKTFKNEEKYNEYLDTMKALSGRKELPHGANKAVKSFSDWIIPACECLGTVWKTGDEVITSIDTDYEENKEKKVVEISDKDAVKELVGKILDFKYPYKRSGEIPAKTSVTAIKEMAEEEAVQIDNPVYMVQKPKFLSSQKSGAQIGTAHHQLMAFIDISKLREISDDKYMDFIKDEFERITNDGQIDEEISGDSKLKNMICENVYGFFTSSTGKDMLEAKNIYRESAFEIEINANEYDPTLEDKYSDEKVMVQGIIDLYYEKNDGSIVLVDYKTDRCSSEEEQKKVSEKYRKQIELYGYAMEKILKKSVKEKYLYLFSPQSVVKLD